MDLTTKYLGLELKNPLVLAASPLSRDLNSLKEAQESGASAVVMYSLFEEQITHEQKELDHFLTYGTDSFAEALSYFPEPQSFPDIEADSYLKNIEELKRALSIPVIASLNGVSKGGWINYAKKMEQAGADALELNIYYVPTDFSFTSEKIEAMYIDALQAVKSSVSIPVALKVGASFTSFAHFAKKAEAAGADGLVLFNRFYGPDIDMENMEVIPKLRLSEPAELQLPLRWIAILAGHVNMSLAATSGVHSSSDVLKAVMAGADIVQIASVLLKKGANYLSTIMREMISWMEEREYSSLQQMKGSMSYQSVAAPAAYERANYMKTLHSYE